MAAAPPTIRIAATADIHCTRTSQDVLERLFSQVRGKADVLLLCGDLTDHGLPEEAELVAREATQSLHIPIIAVLGNHDYESGQQDRVLEILANAGIHMLNGSACEVQGIGFAGTKGFAGGFGRAALEPWGEDSIKQLVRDAVDETLKLESALARLRMPQRIAVLHYAPIAATVAGEPPEIFAFLGSSRLEEPLNRYAVTATFHGHAHHGSLEGRTAAGVPVFNVSMSLLQRSFPDRPPFRMLEVPSAPAATA